MAVAVAGDHPTTTTTVAFIAPTVFATPVNLKALRGSESACD